MGVSIDLGDFIQVNGKQKKVKRVFANPTAAGTDAALVTAVAGKSLRVVGIVASAAGTATDLTLNTKPAGAGTAITPLFPLGVRTPLVLSLNPHGYGETVVGEGLTVTTGAGSTCALIVHYVEVD